MGGREGIQQGHEEGTLQGSAHYLHGHLQYLGSKIRMTDVQHSVSKICAFSFYSTIHLIAPVLLSLHRCLESTLRERGGKNSW